MYKYDHPEMALFQPCFGSFEDPNEHIIPGLNELDVDFLPSSTGTSAGEILTQTSSPINISSSTMPGGTHPSPSEALRLRPSARRSRKHLQSRSSSPVPKLLFHLSGSLFSTADMVNADDFISQMPLTLPISIPISRNSLAGPRRPSFDDNDQIYSNTVVHARDLQLEIISHEEDSGSWGLLNPK